MKIILSAIFFSALALAGINNKAIESAGLISNEISFYKVPLVCNAAPSIGCGSRAKPVLLDLEKSAVIKEAWLNREGNVIAVVWAENSSLDERNKSVVKIFNESNLNASKLMMDDYTTSLESFTSNEGWYRGDDVNALSKEEAGYIADQLMEVINDNTDIAKSDYEHLKREIQSVFYEFFLNFESLDQLADASVYKDKLQAIIDLGEQYVGKGNMPTVNELWNVCSAGNTSCDHDGCNDSSCKVKS